MTADFTYKKLDNSAIIFPAVSNSRNTSVFRYFAVMRDEVEPEALSAALKKTYEQLPDFKVRLRTGLFWWYFEPNSKEPRVEPEHDYPNRAIFKKNKNNFLIRISYFNKKINAEFFHALTDGTGAAVFFKTLLANYLSERYRDKGEKYFINNDLLERETWEDSYVSNADASNSQSNIKQAKAYHIEGDCYMDDRIRVTEGVFDTDRLRMLAKKQGVTITAYLSAALVYAIYKSNAKFSLKKKPIVIEIPVNLRGHYISYTNRNFFAITTLEADLHDKEYSFTELCRLMSEQLRNNLQSDEIHKTFDYYVSTRNNKLVRFVPLFFKKLVMGIVSRKSYLTTTTTISNLGRFDLPDSFCGYIERTGLILTPFNTQPLKASAISFCGKTNFVLSSRLVERDIEKIFFRFLSEEGLDVEIISNE